MGNDTKVQNHEYHVSEECRDDMNVEKPKGVMKTEIDYILTNRPDIVTCITFINQVNIVSDYIMAMSNTKLDVEVETE